MANEYKKCHAKDPITKGSENAIVESKEETTDTPGAKPPQPDEWDEMTRKQKNKWNKHNKKSTNRVNIVGKEPQLLIPRKPFIG